MSTIFNAFLDRQKCGDGGRRHIHKSAEAARDCGLKTFGETAEFIIRDRQPHAKPLSRASRASNAEGSLVSAADAAEELVSDLERALDNDDETTVDFDQLDSREELQAKLNAMDTDASDGKTEVESLAEEMESWESNMSGTGLENTQKYEAVSEASSGCQDAQSECEDATVPALPDELTYATLTTFKDELEEFASSIRQAGDTIAAVEFPGMY